MPRLFWYSIKTFHLSFSESQRGILMTTSADDADYHCPEVHKGAGTVVQKPCSWKATIGQRPYRRGQHEADSQTRRPDPELHKLIQHASDKFRESGVTVMLVETSIKLIDWQKERKK